ncbi:MAG: pyrimidine utilization protein D [Hyphomicrobiales bacterium]|nr:MAG: pyrimidine utilization protein D [Hyphomicrobiales bacterium]
MPDAGGLYYEFHGPERGKVLILSSGLGGSASYWQPNLAALSRDHRVLIYDHRGTGRSDRKLPETTSVEDMAADILALMDALGIETAGFVGHALGGMIGMELAIMTTRIESLIIINGWRHLDAHTRRCFEVRLELLRSSGPEAYLHAQPLFLFPPDWISAHDAELREEARHQLAAFPENATIEKRIAAVQSYDPELIDVTATANWLVIGTHDDMLVPIARSRELAEAVPWGAKFAPLAWGGHACNVTDPERFNALVLEFLGS